MPSRARVSARVDNQIGVEGARSVADALKSNESVTEIDLGCTCAIACSEGATELKRVAST